MVGDEQRQKDAELLRADSYQESIEDEDDVDSIPIVKISLDTPPGLSKRALFDRFLTSTLAEPLSLQNSENSLSKPARPRPAPQSFVIDTEGEMPEGALLREKSEQAEAPIVAPLDAPLEPPAEAVHLVEQVQVVKKVKKKSKRTKETG